MTQFKGIVGYKRVLYLAVCSVIIIAVGEMLHLLVPPGVAGGATAKVLLTTLGSILFGTAIIDGVFQMQFHRQIQDQVTALSKNILTLQDTVMIAKGAVDAGLTAVYATREECLSQIKQKLIQALRNTEGGRETKTINISVLGISLGDFLCPHGSLQPTFRELLKSKSFNIKVAILADGSNAAIYRAIHEEYGKFDGLLKGKKDYASVETEPDIRAVYENTKCHDELKTATDYLRDLTCRHEIDRDEPAHDKRVEAKLDAYVYRAHPMAFMFVVDDDMFIESYHLAGRGGEAPILQVSQFKKQTSREESKLYKIYIGHFESIIQMSEPIVCRCQQEKINGRKTIANKASEATSEPAPSAGSSAPQG